MSRILHLGKFFPPFAGGIENFLADLIPAQLERGHAVAALVHNHPSLAPSRSETTPFPLYRVPCYGQLLYAPISPQFPFWLQRALREFQPDVLHLHLPNTSAFWVLFSSAARRIPWVIHWHADVDSTLNPRLTAVYRSVYRPFEQRLLKTAQTIVATSEPYLDASVALKPWRAKCRVIPLGISKHRVAEPNSQLKTWATQQWLANDVKILSVGRLTYYKGYEFLIRAMAHVKNTQLCIVGQGEQYDYLLNLIQQLQLSSKVKLLGYCPDPELHALFSVCDCFCLASVDRAEAFGLVLMEAMRYAKPVIVSAIPGSGVIWVVVDGETGLFVPPREIHALAERLNDLVDQPALRLRFGHAGFQRFQQLFDVQQVAEKLEALYVCSKKPI